MENISENIVLVAEDDYASCEIFKHQLKKSNTKFIVVNDGLSAVQKVRENPGIKMVFLDIRMPFMDGIEALKKIKGIRDNVPVIAQTAYVNSENEVRQFIDNYGFDDFMAKPFPLRRINELVKKYIN